MAADWQEETKTFSVEQGESGKKEKVWPGYSRLRTVDNKNRTAIDREYWLGLWGKTENYVWAEWKDVFQDGRHQVHNVYRRTQKRSNNGIRKKTSTYHPNGGKSSEERRYPLGFRTGYTYDVDGQILSRSYSDGFYSFKQSRTPDGRKLTLEESDFGNWHRKRQEAVGFPDDRAVRWRTMERHIGSYSMVIEPDKDGKGETKTRSFGKLLGKGWLFKGTTRFDFDGKRETTRRKVGQLGKRSLFERKTEYNFEKGTKEISYRTLFGAIKRTKNRRITESDRENASIHKHEARQANKAEADKAWGAYKAWLADRADPILDGSRAGRGVEESTSAYDRASSNSVSFGESMSQSGTFHGEPIPLSPEGDSLRGSTQGKPPPVSKISPNPSVAEWLSSGSPWPSSSPKDAEIRKPLQQAAQPSGSGRTAAGQLLPAPPARQGSDTGRASQVSSSSISPLERDAEIRKALREAAKQYGAKPGVGDISQQNGQGGQYDKRNDRSRAASVASR